MFAWKYVCLCSVRVIESYYLRMKLPHKTAGPFLLSTPPPGYRCWRRDDSQCDTLNIVFSLAAIGHGRFLCC